MATFLLEHRRTGAPALALAHDSTEYSCLTAWLTGWLADCLSAWLPPQLSFAKDMQACEFRLATVQVAKDTLKWEKWVKRIVWRADCEWKMRMVYLRWRGWSKVVSGRKAIAVSFSCNSSARRPKVKSMQNGHNQACRYRAVRSQVERGKRGETVVWIAHVHGNGKYNNKSKAK